MAERLDTSEQGKVTGNAGPFVSGEALQEVVKLWADGKIPDLFSPSRIANLYCQRAEIEGSLPEKVRDQLEQLKEEASRSGLSSDVKSKIDAVNPLLKETNDQISFAVDLASLDLEPASVSLGPPSFKGQSTIDCHRGRAPANTTRNWTTLGGFQQKSHEPPVDLQWYAPYTSQFQMAKEFGVHLDLVRNCGRTSTPVFKLGLPSDETVIPIDPRGPFARTMLNELRTEKIQELQQAYPITIAQAGETVTRPFDGKQGYLSSQTPLLFAR